MPKSPDIYVSPVRSSYEHNLTFIEILTRREDGIYLPDTVRIGSFADPKTRQRMRREWISSREAEGLLVKPVRSLTEYRKSLCLSYFEPGDAIKEISVLFDDGQASNRCYYVGGAFYSHDRVVKLSWSHLAEMINAGQVKIAVLRTQRAVA